MKGLCIAALLLGAACQPRRETAHGERRQMMEGLTLNQSERGVVSWTLKSSLAVLREDERRARLTRPAMEFYRDGKVVSRVTALFGDVDTDTQDVRLSSSVVLDSYEDRSRLTTTDLVYSSARKRFTTTAYLQIKRPEGLLHGKGLEATPDLSEIRIFEQRSILKAQ